MKEIGIEKFLKQFADSPARLAWIKAYLADDASARALFSAVDDGPYSLSQWVDAFIIMGHWLDAHEKRASFVDQLGYVHCACEAVGAGANLTPLSDHVTEMLETYGFDQAVGQ